MGTFPQLFDPHRTWALWLQLPLLLVVLAMTQAELRRVWRETGAGRGTALLALAAVALGLWLVPWEQVPWSGHEEHYRELLLGGPAEAGSLESTNAFPFPAGIAWFLGLALPDGLAEFAWRAGNRLSLAVVLVCLGAAASSLVGGRIRSADRGFALLLGVALGACAVPALGWSATGFAVTPAMAMAALGLVLATRGDGAGALAWTALAFATRMEWAALVGGLPLIALVAGPALRGHLARWAVALGVLAAECLFYAAKHGGLPGRPNPSIALENLANIPLGGAWHSPWVLIATAAVCAVAAPPRLRGLLGGAWALALLAVYAQLATIVDLGARHLLPGTLLLVPLVAASLAHRVLARSPAPGVPARRRPRLKTAVATLFVVGLTGLGARDAQLQRHRVLGEQPGVPPRVHIPASPATGTIAEMADPACILVLPHGEQSAPGAWDAFDVGNVHTARLAQEGGACVQWAFQPDVRFAGDTRLEFADRAIATLGLEPEAWITRPDGGRWLLMEGRR